jgi:hypothetical protein
MIVMDVTMEMRQYQVRLGLVDIRLDEVDQAIVHS